MKRTLSFLLSLVLAIGIITSVPVTVSAASESDLAFTLNDDGVSYSVAECNSDASGKIVIPNTYNGLTVTSIGENAFSGCTSLTSITIPDSVTSICDSAFWDCTSLTNVSIPNSVTTIDDGAFANCESLSKISIPDSVTNIGSLVFCGTGYYNNSSNWVNGVLYIGNHLIEAKPEKISSTYNIRNNTKSIADDAFENCSSLSKITIPNGVTRIGCSTFYNCTNLSSVTIPNSVTSIDSWAFSGCFSLKTISLPNSLKYIGRSAFEYCINLISIIIPNSVTTIDDGAFANCESLSKISIPDSVTSIGNDAFCGCVSLTKIQIPESVIYLGVYAIDGCTNLAEINVDSNNKIYSSIDGVLFNKDKSILIKYPAGKTNTYYSIPNSVIDIDEYSFYSCSYLEKIVIPDSVTNIWYSAFEDCSSLAFISIADSVETIYPDAFLNTDYYNNSSNWLKGVLYVGNHLIKANSTELGTTYNIKSGTKTIAVSAFSDCTTLTSVTIAGSVTDIGRSAFESCTSLTNLTIENGVKNIGSDAFTYCYNLFSIILPDSVTSIGNGAFDETSYYNNPSNWENGVLYIDEYLIKANWRELGTTYTIKNGTKIISNSAFTFTDIQKVIIPDSVTHIGSDAFFCCGDLETVILPASLVSIGSYAFSGCNCITNVFFAGTEEEWKAIDIGKANECLTNVERQYLCKHTKTSWITDTKATVYKAGSKHKECTECGEVLETAEIPQLKCSKPSIKSASNSGKDVKISWSSVSGADNYYVYRKVSGGSYSYIGETTKTYFIDEKVSAGKTYTYKLRAKNEAGYSDYSSTKTVKHLDLPSIKTPENTTSGVKISWSKVTGASGYKVYRKTSDGWKYLGKTSKTYFTDKTAKSGKKYTYTVKAYSGDYNSSYNSAGVSKYYLADPTLKTPTSTKSGVSLKWTKVTGAQGYIIYRKTGSGSYKKLKTEKGVSNLSYRDTSAKKGKKYTYKIKAYYSKTYSAYSNTKTIKDKY